MSDILAKRETIKTELESLKNKKVTTVELVLKARQILLTSKNVKEVRDDSVVLQGSDSIEGMIVKFDNVKSMFCKTLHTFDN